MDPLEQIKEIQAQALEMISKADTELALSNVRNAYLAKKSPLSAMMGKMKEVPNEEKASFGKAINDARSAIVLAYEEKLKKVEEAALNLKLESEKIDISLPAEKGNVGHTNPYMIIVDEMVSIFSEMGFEIIEGKDIETDHFNFELLNVPKDHPARDMQDTFYIDESLLLRTQTSAAQAHVMLEKGGKEPIKMICPGKCYRRDDDDMTHSHQFGQIEGLVVDKGISMADLKGTLEVFVKKMFGEKREIRLRSSYFPFTEPSVEVDVSCAKCGGKGCDMCKGSGWIEILGAGEVNPKVLEMCGYDPKVYSGFAFGVGIDRLAILRYGIDDIRRLYQNDVRFLEPFVEK
ncbi:MAG: phenylalanine--tRNA ligase subunit alpha [Bacilli bacterium]|jgi:phenylalanyl-tRNA synthetase alpha chain|nr:phenylalanine--tRNA ligase subunit alpha [Bacilli bacterium]MCH4210590.1 phenylalanine--tRNA ligase subunit alpha [Bacilli bacterium]MCH4228548.1 phenylalanine--tRNA ligase subunit alpha [Bacilli bacterium]MCH4277316.1 phenylalanine--tRNA ligase subunit alpha [Bacilli bacterium]MCI2055228.1 phenylalanine--tRNA ligase subunit alpha [Bacilli bacterium]